MTDLVKIEVNTGTLAIEYANGRSVEIDRINDIHHVGIFQDQLHEPKGIIRPKVLHFQTEELAVLSKSLRDAYNMNETIHRHLAVNGGDTYEFKGLVASPGDVTTVWIAKEIKRMRKSDCSQECEW